MSIFVFPDKLRSGEYPYMLISVPDVGLSIHLYTPPGISFQDGAGYGSMNLGSIGGSLMGKNSDALMKKMESQLDEAMATSLKDVGDAVSRGYNVAKSQAGMIAAGILSKAPRGLPGIDNIASTREMISFASKRVLNPYAVSSFTGVSARSYTFSFKFIADTAEESRMLRDMIRAIRENMYPEEDGQMVLKYPNIFNVSFFDGSSENEFIPKIYDCYLISMSTTYNQTESTFFADGSPSEIDLALSFQETRPLSANDLKLLEDFKIRSFEGRNKHKQDQRAAYRSDNANRID